MMSTFESSLAQVLSNEGGYVHDPDDPGGETYKGVARTMHSKWAGWEQIDLMKNKPDFPKNLDNNQELQEEIAHFYRVHFWNRLKGDDIKSPQIAHSIFDFGVNAGVKTSAKLAQSVVKATPDGVMGPRSLDLLNAFDEDHFLAAFTVAKIARYVAIIKKRPTSRKYLYGWIRRALGEH